MALSLANNYLEVVEIVVNDRNDRRNENVVKSEYESEHKEQEMEVDSGGGEQESERLQQSSEENNVPDVSEAHCSFYLVPKLSNLESKQSFLLIASLCTSVIDSDSVVTENQCLVGDHYLYSCDLNVWFRGSAYHVLSAAQNLRGPSTAVRKFGQSTSSQRPGEILVCKLEGTGKKHLELILSLIVLLFLKTLIWNDSNGNQLQKLPNQGKELFWARHATTYWLVTYYVSGQNERIHKRSDHDLLIDQLKLGRGVHLVLFEVKVIG
ncbi:hypothetical protein pdam_00008309 [Pocillopora damicornis]|uniref:Uncharacterized protein n=1 Tax=Pocillopora damicornis TaxID=46731 RepID=A0A3M6U687_POCDA|nr:hypothetical protein pdam_00008309 [Pocillopora damicornis]